MIYVFDFISHLEFSAIILNIFGPAVDFGEPHTSFYQTAIKPHAQRKGKL